MEFGFVGHDFEFVVNIRIETEGTCRKLFLDCSTPQTKKDFLLSQELQGTLPSKAARLQRVLDEQQTDDAEERVLEILETEGKFETGGIRYVVDVRGHGHAISFLVRQGEVEVALLEVGLIPNTHKVPWHIRIKGDWDAFGE